MQIALLLIGAFELGFGIYRLTNPDWRWQGWWADHWVLAWVVGGGTRPTRPRFRTDSELPPFDSEADRPNGETFAAIVQIAVGAFLLIGGVASA